MRETVSALLDAELEAKDRDGVLDRLTADPELRATWGRYYVIRSVLRREFELPIRGDISSRVMAALDREPLVLVENVKAPISMAPKKYRPVARLALAASLTAVTALFGLRMVMEGVGNQTPAQPLSTALEAPLTVPQPYIERAHWTGPKWRNRLNAYLLEHAAVAPFAGINGLSYVRLTAFQGLSTEPPSK